MAETASNMLPLGTKAHSFTLLDTLTNQRLSLEELQSNKATVIMFICNHCPYVKHIQKKLVEVVKTYQKAGIAFIGINSNDVIHYPADAPDKMRQEGEINGYTFPYLYDETQEVAKAYQAACTPDFTIFNSNMECIYRGRFDDSTPGNSFPVTGKDLCQALDNVLLNQEIHTNQYPSLGCNIKWKKTSTAPM